MNSLLLKYIIVGDSSVGKSCILLQFLENRFSPDRDSTIGVEFGCKNLSFPEANVKLQIWDTAGQESFKSITRSYYRGSICCLLVYDITNKETFLNCLKWLEETRNFTNKDVIIVLVGNKSDLENREISEEDGEAFAKKHNLLFFETSAKTGQNIDKIFNESASLILQKIEKGEINPSDNFGIKVMGSLTLLTRDVSRNSYQKRRGCSC